MRVVAEIAYERVRQIGIGQGRNSTVYLADEPQLGGQVVVKEIPKANFSDPAAFFDEAKAMFAAATRNVVPIQYACQTTDEVCLVMPFCPNGSLADRIAGGPIGPANAVATFLRVLSGVAEIHAKGLIHFDIKPTNILFDASDEPLVADFGQSRPVNPVGVAVVPRPRPTSISPGWQCTGR